MRACAAAAPRWGTPSGDATRLMVAALAAAHARTQPAAGVRRRPAPPQSWVRPGWIPACSRGRPRPHPKGAEFGLCRRGWPHGERAGEGTALCLATSVTDVARFPRPLYPLASANPTRANTRHTRVTQPSTRPRAHSAPCGGATAILSPPPHPRHVGGRTSARAPRSQGWRRGGPPGRVCGLRAAAAVRRAQTRTADPAAPRNNPISHTRDLRSSKRTRWI